MPRGWAHHDHHVVHWALAEGADVVEHSLHCVKTWPVLRAEGPAAMDKLQEEEEENALP